jgi:hypothetical protein
MEINSESKMRAHQRCVHIWKRRRWLTAHDLPVNNLEKLE